MSISIMSVLHTHTLSKKKKRERELYSKNRRQFSKPQEAHTYIFPFAKHEVLRYIESARHDNGISIS